MSESRRFVANHLLESDAYSLDELQLTGVSQDISSDPSMHLGQLRYEALVRADHLIRSVGSLALKHEVEPDTPMSLFEALKLAAEHQDSEALSLIKINVKTDFIERVLKSGHISKIYQQRNECGQIVQHNQTAEDTQRNTLKYANWNPAMRPRTRSETANMYLIESFSREGLLADNYAVAVSLCPDMDDVSLNELGFFAFSKSLSIQATTAEGDEIVTESAFIAGVEREGADRKDQAVAVKFGQQFGEDWHGLDDSQIIQRVMLIPKHRMPNGIVDLVNLWDGLAGGTFFGQAKPRQDYCLYREQCSKREAAFEPTIQKIVEKLIASTPYISSPLEATDALDRIAKAFALELALVDNSIDERVFGCQAAMDLAEARFHYERGNIQYVHLAMSSAHKHNDSGSCASGARGSADSTSAYNEDGTLKTPEQLAEEGVENALDESDEYGSLKFNCQRGCANTRPRGKLIPKCTKCGIELACGIELKRSATKQAQRQESLLGIFMITTIFRKKVGEQSAYGLAS